MPQVYGDGSNSTIGSQLRTDYYKKTALIEAKKSQFFTQLADTTAMPKHMGKKIKQYLYLPLLDDANINDQGIDAAGLTTTRKCSITVTNISDPQNVNLYINKVFVGEGANEAAAILAAKTAANVWMGQSKDAGGLGLTLVGGDEATKYTDGVNSTDGLAYVLGYRFEGDTTSDPYGGNLYGSSKDVGTIAGKLPALSETGGRVNRVGFKRVELEGSFAKFGFFDEYTQESLDFDTDAELDQHVNREMILGANEMTEDALQIDLLNGAGVIRFGGEALQDSEVTGANGSVASLINYNDLMRLAIDLDNNRCPKSTKIITGSRMIDTKTVGSTRYIYIGSELIPMVKKMVDTFGDKAFVPVQQYGNGGTVAEGEIGAIDQFRFIVVPEMMHWAGAGAVEGTNDGYRATGGNYDIFPMLVVGSGSFTTIGFQTDGKTVKFKIHHKKPGSETADRNDPYGEVGFMSIKWYYGTMILRPERIGLCKCVAEY